MALSQQQILQQQQLQQYLQQALQLYQSSPTAANLARVNSYQLQLGIAQTAAVINNQNLAPSINLSSGFTNSAADDLLNQQAAAQALANPLVLNTQGMLYRGNGGSVTLRSLKGQVPFLPYNDFTHWIDTGGVTGANGYVNYQALYLPLLAQLQSFLAPEIQMMKSFGIAVNVPGDLSFTALHNLPPSIKASSSVYQTLSQSTAQGDWLGHLCEVLDDYQLHLNFIAHGLSLLVNADPVKCANTVSDLKSGRLQLRADSYYNQWDSTGVFASTDYPGSFVSGPEWIGGDWRAIQTADFQGFLCPFSPSTYSWQVLTGKVAGPDGKIGVSAGTLEYLLMIGCIGFLNPDSSPPDDSVANTQVQNIIELGLFNFPANGAVPATDTATIVAKLQAYAFNARSAYRAWRINQEGPMFPELVKAVDQLGKAVSYITIILAVIIQIGEFLLEAAGGPGLIIGAWLGSYSKNTLGIPVITDVTIAIAAAKVGVVALGTAGIIDAAGGAADAADIDLPDTTTITDTVSQGQTDVNLAKTGVSDIPGPSPSVDVPISPPVVPGGSSASDILGTLGTVVTLTPPTPPPSTPAPAPAKTAPPAKAQTPTVSKPAVVTPPASKPVSPAFLGILGYLADKLL